MRQLLAVSLLLFTLVNNQAQNIKLDSLNKLLLRSRSNTARVDLTNEKIAILIKLNIDSALHLSLQNINQSQRIHYRAGEAYCRTLLAKTYSFKGDYRAANINLQAAKIIYAYLQDSAGILKVYNGYGILYGMQSKYDSSLLYFAKGLAIAERNHYKAEFASLYTNIGISYKMLSNNPQAFYYEQKALLQAEAVGDVNSQAIALINIANTYRDMDDNQAAVDRFNQAIQLAKHAGVKDVELYAYTNLAGMYGGMHDNQKAYEFAMKAAELGKQMGNQAIQATSLSRAATALAEQKQFTQSRSLIRQALAIGTLSRQPLIIHQTYSAMGSILRLQRQYADAITYFEKSFAALKNADIYDAQTGDMYRELSTCYERTGNYRLALSTHKLAAAIADSVRSKENVRRTTELSMTYAFEKKQQALKVEQQKKNVLAQTRQFALGGGLVLMLVLVSVVYYAYRTKQKANTLLLHQKEELQTTLIELQQTHNRLKATQAQLIHSEKMASLGVLTAGIAHEIQNPLNFVMNFSELSISYLEELVEDRKHTRSDLENENQTIDSVVKNLVKINHHGKRASNIVSSMLEHSGPSHGQRQLIVLNSLVETYVGLAYKGFTIQNKGAKVEVITQLKATIGRKVNVIPQELGRVLLNLLNNAFYAVDEQQQVSQESYLPTVTVSTKHQLEHVQIRVHDNGTGIDTSLLSKIFQPFFTTKPPGKGTGLGLSLSYDIITQGHSGTLTVESQVGHGTTFIITLFYGRYTTD